MAPEGGEPTLLCTGRAHTQSQTGTKHIRRRGHAWALSLFLLPPVFVAYIHARVQRVPTTLSRSRGCGGIGGAALSRIHAICLYASDAGLWCTRAPGVPTLRPAVSLSRECSQCSPPFCRGVCVHMRERAYTRGDNAAARRTHRYTRRLGELQPRPPLSRAPRHLASLTYDTIRASPQGRQVAHKTKETRERRQGERDSDGERSGKGEREEME